MPGDCLFGAMNWTKNADADKYWYSGYGIGFGACSQFLLPRGDLAKLVLVFGVDNSLPLHADNMKKDIVILGEGPIDRLDDTSITTEAKYSIDITKSREKVCLSLYCIAASRFFYVKNYVMV